MCNKFPPTKSGLIFALRSFGNTIENFYFSARGWLHFASLLLCLEHFIDALIMFRGCSERRGEKVTCQNINSPQTNEKKKLERQQKTKSLPFDSFYSQNSSSLQKYFGKLAIGEGKVVASKEAEKDRQKLFLPIF